ncbi:MAG: PASTA domain-containing protein [Clostridia bacterium]|nr:PASTA domain-containing protein [Clostridia bacterium]
MQHTDNLCMGCMSETGRETVCSVCGFDENTYNEPEAIKLRTVLAGRYVVGKVLSSNGGGYTYLAFDNLKSMVVTLREYYPTGFCTRGNDNTVIVASDENFTYNDGLLKFIELYKNLASLNEIKAIFRVFDIFETNNTAYCVSEYLPGITLKEFLLRNGGNLKWEQVRPLFLPLISAIKAMHSAGIVHGGISPETLVVGRDGRIRLTGFRIPEIRNAKSNMTSQLFPGFAAIEQYEGEELTTSTDVYSFAATLFRTLTGNPPTDALSRLEKDNMTFQKSVAEELPRGVLIALANALQLRKEDRTQTIDGFKEHLESSDVVMAPAKEKTEDKKVSNISTKKYTIIAAVATAVVLLVLAVIVYFAILKKPAEDKNSTSVPSVPSVVSVGDIGNPSRPESLFSTPDFSNQTYASLIDNDEYKKWFIFSVVKKEYNDKVERGKVCGQSVAVGTNAKRDTKVELTISLGPKEVTLSKKLAGMTKDQAYVTLLELGFDPANIEFVEKRGDTATKEEVIIEASPELGSKLSPDEAIILYYNSNLIQNESSSNTDNSQDENAQQTESNSQSSSSNTTSVEQ